jgi:glutathione S-transferase
MADLTLYGSIEGSRSWWVAWICRELGIGYQNQHTEGYLDPFWKTPEYLAINPNGLMPSIEDGDFVLWESMAINLYLARKYGSASLRLAALEQEALAWQWSFWAMTRLEVPFLVVAASNNNFAPGSELEQYFLKHVPMWTPHEVERSRSVLVGPLDVLNKTLSTSPYLLGQDFSVADLNVAMVMSRNLFAKVNLFGRPHLRDWLHRCWSREACPRKSALLEALRQME